MFTENKISNSIYGRNEDSVDRRTSLSAGKKEAWKYWNKLQRRKRHPGFRGCIVSKNPDAAVHLLDPAQDTTSRLCINMPEEKNPVFGRYNMEKSGQP